MFSEVKLVNASTYSKICLKRPLKNRLNEGLKAAALRLRGLIYHMRVFFSTKVRKKYYHMRV